MEADGGHVILLPVPNMKNTVTPPSITVTPSFQGQTGLIHQFITNPDTNAVARGNSNTQQHQQLAPSFLPVGPDT